MSLEEHDRRYHGGCYKPGSYCAYRDWIRKYEGVDQLLAKGSLGELRQRMSLLEADIKTMYANNDAIVAKQRMELGRLTIRERNNGLSADETKRRDELQKDILRRNELEQYVPYIARARLFSVGRKDSHIKIGTTDGIRDDELEAFRLVAGALFPQELIPKNPISIFRVDNEDRAETGGNVITIPKKAPFPKIVHEFAHIVEKANPLVRQGDIAFLDYRCRGERSVKLRDILKDKRYKDDETCRPDKFFHAYCGKNYFSKKDGRRVATEILSMGVELLLNDPSGFLEVDPEYFKLCSNILKGVM